ncbi:hypothetical protein RI367_002966 [Sorochytrium milnesiophthora]
MPPPSVLLLAAVAVALSATSLAVYWLTAVTAVDLLRPQPSAYEQQLLLPLTPPDYNTLDDNLGNEVEAEGLIDDFLKGIKRLAGKWRRSGLYDECKHSVEAFPCTAFDDYDGIHPADRDALHVRYSDIEVIATLGDSISAGFGMRSGKAPFTRPLEFRGLVFNVGGDDGAFTLPNYLRVYTPRLVGAPTWVSLPLAHGKALDRAVSGSIVQDLPRQTHELLKLLTRRAYKPRREYSWKLVNLFVGANNVCRICQAEPGEGVAAPSAFEAGLRDTLSILQDGTDRVLVNLIGLFNISTVYDVAMENSYCTAIFERFGLCPCISHSPEIRQAMDKLAVRYNGIMQRVAHEFDGNPLFKVNFQPGLVDVDIPQFGQEYLSKLDCFHPNLCANQAMSVGLWANMIQEEGKKTTRFDPYNLTWTCPSPQNMYIH